jgi:DNA-binding NarL/FixJ family response regulator
MTRPRVILADDHAVVAEALGAFLRDACDLVAVVHDGRELVDAVKRFKPDVVVSDMSMPQLSGLDALRVLKSEGVEARFVFLTMHADAQVAGEAMRTGAKGYLLKNCAGEELQTAVTEVMRGRVYLTPMLAGRVLEAMASPETPPLEKLTVRQREVLRLVAEGRSMKEIATELKLSPRTIETHKYEMMRSLQLETTAELIQFAVRNGLLQ